MRKYISSEKILYHPARLAKWLSQQTITPITVQMQPSNICNQECVYCIAEVQKDGTLIDTDEALKAIDKMSSMGVRGITFTGGGEPTLHEGLCNMIVHARARRLEIGIETNGASLTELQMDVILSNSTWIRISLDSVDRSVYYMDRGTDDLSRVLANITFLVSMKRRRNAHITIGAQTVLTPNNYRYIRQTSDALKGLGVDYYQIRPMENSNYDDEVLQTATKEMAISKTLHQSSTYEVIISDKWKYAQLTNASPREYDQCWCYPFIGAIDAHGEMYICCHMAQIQERKYFCYGNAVYDSTEAILLKREEVAHNIDFRYCPQACRGASLNITLQALIHENNHVNFL